MPHAVVHVIRKRKQRSTTLARIVYIPQCNPHSFLHLSPRAAAYRARRYWRDSQGRPLVETVLSSQDGTYTDEQVQQMIEINLPAPRRRIEDAGFWADTIASLNKRHNLGSQVPAVDLGKTTAPSVRPVQPQSSSVKRPGRVPVAPTVMPRPINLANQQPSNVTSPSMTWQRPLHAALNQLIKDFRTKGHQFFSERELHGRFFELARNALGTCKTADGHAIHRLRAEYNSVFRYRRADGYQQRYVSEGMPLSFDFAVLHEHFVTRNDLLTVINKDETRRQSLRALMGQPHLANPAMAAAVEFKMAHRSSSVDVGDGKINKLRQEMIIDARKLAQEQIRFSYLVGFAHGTSLTKRAMESIAHDCATAFGQIWPNGRLCVVLATRDNVYQRFFRRGVDRN